MTSWGVGVATVSKVEKIQVIGEPKRIILTISWVDDSAGTTLAIIPATYGIMGYYLYSAETNPGATAPTDLYDITLIDGDGVDIAGSTLLNRATATSQLVNIGTAVHGYPVIRGTFTFTLANNAVVGGLGTCILTFTHD